MSVYRVETCQACGFSTVNCQCAIVDTSGADVQRVEPEAVAAALGAAPAPASVADGSAETQRWEVCGPDGTQARLASAPAQPATSAMETSAQCPHCGEISTFDVEDDDGRVVDTACVKCGEIYTQADADADAQPTTREAKP